ncbi:MAG: hypothetical protein SFZ24_04360 [Planctomycetota bacterium]|nr:hypothetical protein [Planctomycetota bacterium]
MAVITGLFNTAAAASSAVNALEARGVPSSDISLIAAEGTRHEAFGIDTKTKAPEGAALGAGLGGATGALIAGLTMVGALATGGVGLLAAGPLVAALAGAGAGAAAGGAIGTAIGFAIPENEVKHYDEAFRKGAVLVGVQATGDDRDNIVRDVLKNSGATKVAKA